MKKAAKKTNVVKPKKAPQKPAKGLKLLKKLATSAVKVATRSTKGSQKPQPPAKALSKPVVAKGKVAQATQGVLHDTKGLKKSPTAAKGKVSKNLSTDEKKAQILAELTAQKTDAEVILTNADGKQYCRVHDCDNEATTEGHCRFHYLALWKRNKIKAKILQGGKLDKYIEDLTAKYPDKYLEMLRKDLANEKDFNVIVAEMDVEDSGDEAEAEEDTNRFIEEVRGGIPTPDDDEGTF